jgi:hypothetical protein
MNSVPRRRATCDTIINTGGLRLIRDAALAGEIQADYARVDSIRSFEEVMQLTRQRFVEAQRQIGFSPVDDHSMDEQVDLFRGDAAMTAAAKECWLFTNFHLRLLADHRASAERLAAILTKADPHSDDATAGHLLTTRERSIWNSN